MQIPLLSQMAAKRSNQKLLYENELKDSHQSIYTLIEIPIFCSISQARGNRITTKSSKTLSKTNFRN